MKQYLDKIKDSGFTAFLAGGLAVAFGIFGMWFVSGIALGFFIKANWDLISDWLEGKSGIRI